MMRDFLVTQEVDLLDILFRFIHEIYQKFFKSQA
jgi:hypothetical protein